MAEDPSQPNAMETDEAPSSTGGLPPDYFDVPEPPESSEDAEPRSVGDEPLPPRVAESPGSPRVMIDRRISLTVVLVVIVGNMAFFLGGGLAGWAAARKGAARPEIPAPPASNAVLSEDLLRAIDARAPRSEVDALNSRIGVMQSEVATLRRDLAELEGRLNARIRAAPTAPRAPAPPAAPDLAPLESRLDDLVKKSQSLAPLPATFESLRRRVDALDRGLNAVRSEVAAVPKQVDRSLNALKDAIVSRPAPAQTNPAELGRDLGSVLFRGGKYPAAREVFLLLVQNYPNDARLWYFAALANGLTSGNWSGESEVLVRRGLECEQRGSPTRAEIDAQFSTLTKEQGRDWLEEWRKRMSR